MTIVIERPHIQQFMTRSPATIEESLTLADARDRMNANNLRHLPVLNDEGALVGLLSARDIAVAMAVSGKDAGEIAVAQAMSQNPFTCGPHAKLHAVAQEMEKHHYGSAVVVDEGGAVIGIFTITDALRALRQIETGTVAKPEVEPTHVTPPPAERPVVSHPHLSTRGVSPNTGNITPTS